MDWDCFSLGRLGRGFCIGPKKINPHAHRFNVGVVGEVSTLPALPDRIISVSDKARSSSSSSVHRNSRTTKSPLVNEALRRHHWLGVRGEDARRSEVVLDRLGQYLFPVLGCTLIRCSGLERNDLEHPTPSLLGHETLTKREWVYSAEASRARWS